MRGLYVAMTPARTARSGNNVPQGKSNFGLLLSAMISSGCSDQRKIRSGFTGRVCLIDSFVLRQAYQRQQRVCKKPPSDSHEREKTAPGGWEQYLHRAP